MLQPFQMSPEVVNKPKIIEDCEAKSQMKLQAAEQTPGEAHGHSSAQIPPE